MTSSPVAEYRHHWPRATAALLSRRRVPPSLAPRHRRPPLPPPAIAPAHARAATRASYTAAAPASSIASLAPLPPLPAAAASPSSPGCHRLSRLARAAPPSVSPSSPAKAAAPPQARRLPASPAFATCATPGRRCHPPPRRHAHPRRSLHEQVRGTIEKELGKPMSELFATFDLDPLATASHKFIVQLWKMPVKVQHDGIKEIILEYLKNAKSLIEWIAWAEPQYDFNPMIDEWCKEAPKELDFNHEAENTRTVSKNLSWKTEGGSGSVSSDVDGLIPEIIQSTEKILILEYMDGIRLHDNDSLEEYGVNKKKLVEEITRAYAHQIYIDGFFNGDPHPGLSASLNVRIVYLDIMRPFAESTLLGTLGHHQNLKNEISSPISVLERKSDELHKVQFHGASPMLHVTTMEKATKWEPDNMKRMESHDAYLIASQLNLLDEQQDASYVANLQLELRQARDRVGELESECRSTKKNP
ncbi:hypothetical protein ZWY2020_051397 [Hordeum vulgare]|nr:hypothetical protein ZWY2020_051397 [Hordeum vulgare]